MRFRSPVIALLAAALSVPVALPATAQVPAAPRALVAAKASGSVTLQLSASTTQVAKRVTARVSVDPGAKRRVEIQTRLSTTAWQTVAVARTNAQGRVNARFTTYREGAWRVRAVASGSGATSPTRRLTSTYPSFTPPPSATLAPMKPGDLQVARGVGGVRQIAGFRVSIDAGRAAVTVSDAKGRVVWASAPGRSFVSAARSRVRWFQRSTAGAFWPQITRLHRLRDQTVASARVSGQTLTLRGVVSGGDRQSRYEMTLTPQPRSETVTALRMEVQFRPKGKDVTPNSVQITSGRSAGSGVHGFGTQFQDFDLSGQVLPVMVQEQGITRGEKPAAKTIDEVTWGAGDLQTTYSGWPTYVTDDLRSFALDDLRRSGSLSVADMRRARQVSLESFSGQLTALALAGDDPADLLAARAAGTTRPPLVDWVTRGAVLGLQGGTDKVRQVVQEMQDAGTKISAVWLQDWVGKRVTTFGEQLWWTWQLNRSTYPGWEQMVADLNAEGIRVLTYVNPFVINQGRVNGQPIRNLYAEAAKKGFLVKNQKGGKPYVVQTIGFPTGLVDLTNPKARDWFAGVIADEVLGVGAAGFMADFGEYLPMDAKLANGTPRTQHNRWPQLWARTVRQACREGGVPDCMAFFRSSYLGSPRNVPLMWAGDQMVNYAEEDGMANAVLGMLAGGVSGAPLWHSDVGGYTSVNAVVTNFLRSPQLNARWAEMQAFGVVMRTHETNRPRLNQQVYDTPETRAQFARASQIFAALGDYRAGVVQQAVRDGIPAMRHGWQVVPGTKAAQADLQFFLGDHLLVAPVYAEGASSVDVTFPPGQWRHILTGQVYDGDTTTTVPAPLGTPAAFVKVGDPVGDQIVAAIQAAGL